MYPAYLSERIEHWLRRRRITWEPVCAWVDLDNGMSWRMLWREWRIAGWRDVLLPKRRRVVTFDSAAELIAWLDDEPC